MTDTTNNEKGRRPELNAYIVNTVPNGKTYWNKVGAAWSHKDEKGFDVFVGDQRLVLRKLRDQKMQDYDQQQATQQQSNQQNVTQQPAQGYEPEI